MSRSWGCRLTELLDQRGENVGQQASLPGDAITFGRGCVIGHGVEKLLTQSEPAEGEEDGVKEIRGSGSWPERVIDQPPDVDGGFRRHLAHGVTNLGAGAGVAI